MTLYIVCGDKGVYAHPDTDAFTVYKQKWVADANAKTRGAEAHVVEVEITAVLPDKVTP